MKLFFIFRHISPDADEIQKTPNKTDSSPKTTDDIKTIQVGSEKLRVESSEAKSDSSSSAACARVSEIPASPRPAEECTELIYTERIGVCQEKYLGAVLEVATLEANRSCTGKDRPQDCSSSVTDSSSETLEYERCSEELSDSEVCETLQEKLPEAELEVDPTTRDALSTQAEECSSSITDSCSDTVEYDLSDSALDSVEHREIKQSPKKALIPGKHTKVLKYATSSPQHPKRELRQKEPSSSTPSLPCHMNTRQIPIEKVVQEDVEEHAVEDSDVSECDQESIAEPCDVGTDGTEYECKYCPYTTVVRHNVELHVRKHISYRPMQCSYCSFTATLAGDVKEHINGTHPERPVVIKRNRIAAIEASLGKHFMQKSSVKRYPKRTRSVSIERYQLNRDQLGKESGKKIDKEGVTSQNKRKVTDDGKRPRKFQKGKSGSRALCPRVEKESIHCRLCSLEMPSDAYLEDHMATFHKDYTGFKCTYCGVHIRFKKKMLSHLNKKHPSGELKYRRIVNGVQLKEVSKTARKIRKAKKIGKVKKSGNARKTGKGKKTGKLSKQSKQDEPSKERTPISARDVGNIVKFSCKHCPHTSTNRQYIKEHVMVHMDYRPYTCGNCPFVAIRKQYITLHSEKKHPGLKPVVTRIPNKTKESSLTQHFTSDSSCDKELSKKNLLNKTQLRIRKKYRASSQRRKQSKMSKVKRNSTTESTNTRGRKMLSCKHCSYTSTIPRLMKQHVMNHINYKPFKCRHCDYRSVRSDSVKDHSISKHPEKPVKVLITRDAGIEASLSKLFCEKLEMHTEKAIGKQPTQDLNLLTLGKTQQVKRQVQNEKAVEEQLSASQDLPPTLEKVQKVSRLEQSGHVSVGKKYPSKVIISSTDRRETSVEKQLSASQDLPPTLEKVQNDRRETSASFVCKHCPHEAVTEHGIKDHVMSHTQYKPFQCLHCSYQATRPSHVRAHSRRNHPNQMHGMKGGHNTEPLLENHYTRKEGSNVETPQKGDSFKRKRRAHEESSPSKRAKLPEKGAAQNSSENKRAEAECYKCVKCGGKYSSRATALRHIMSELNFRPWSCPHCTFKDDTLVIVKKHCSEHHPTKPFKAVFNHVDMARVKTLISQSKMKQASESGTTSGEVKRGNSQKSRPSVPHVFHCEHCPYQSQVKVCFQKHILLHGSQRFQCGYCPHRAFFKCDLKRHMAKRHKNKPCKVISLRSQEILTKKEATRVKHNSSQADSSNTRSSVHGRSKVRPKTSKVNALRRSPKKGRQRNPKEVNLYGCEECPFQSLDRASFQMHILIHKPKRFQCGYCRYSGYFKYQIVNHMRKLHKTKPHRIILLENGPVEGEDSSDDIIEIFPREDGGILAELEAELEEMARGDYQGVESDVPSSIKKEDMSQLFKSAVTSGTNFHLQACHNVQGKASPET